MLGEHIVPQSEAIRAICAGKGQAEVNGNNKRVAMCGLVLFEELHMCGWGPYTREASVLEACFWYSGVINMS